MDTYTPYRYSEGMGALVTIGDSLREAFFMCWDVAPPATAPRPSRAHSWS